MSIPSTISDENSLIPMTSCPNDGMYWLKKQYHPDAIITLDWMLQDSLLDSRAYAFWFAGSESSSGYIETMDQKYLAHEILPIVTTYPLAGMGIWNCCELKSRHHLGLQNFSSRFYESFETNAT